jgi:hypothetical protein
LVSALTACPSTEELCRAAVYHGMLGHLHRVLTSEASTSIDAGVGRRISELQRMLMVRNMRYAAALLEILNQLDSKGVQAVAVKGPVWAELLYGDLTSRTWSDLDLLVGRGQVARAREALQEMGFEDCGPFGERAMRSRWGDTGQIALGSRDLGLVVDLHWKLTVAVSPRGLTSEPVLARAASVTVLGEQVRCPGESDVFMITCLEGTRDLWSSVARLLDLGVLIGRTTPAGWDDLLAAARAAGCERRVLVGVGYVSRLLSVEIPDFVTARMETDRRTKALLGHLHPSYLCGAPPLDLRGRLTLFWVHAAGEDRRRDALRFVLARLFAPTTEDWDAFSLPRRMGWLYVPLRPLRLAGKWFARMLRMGKTWNETV